MEAGGVEWGEDYRTATRAALKQVLETRMGDLISGHLDAMARCEIADRRNGHYRRWLMTELGEIELCVPRTRRFSARSVLSAYARRAPQIDRLVLACFVLGLSTRKVATALLPILGRRISPATVSRIARSLDAAVAAFHRRPLKDVYRALMLDGVVLARKTGAGALRRPVLVALGIRPDGRMSRPRASKNHRKRFRNLSTTRPIRALGPQSFGTGRENGQRSLRHLICLRQSDAAI